MKFIYDILLNLNDRLYEFYEWDTDDDIEYFKKIPLFKLEAEAYKNIEIGSIIDDRKFLDSIYNISEIYDNKRVRLVNYVCLFTNGKDVIGTLLNKNGKVIMVSKLYIDEEVEVLDVAYNMNETPLSIINGNIIKIENNYFLTRAEERKKTFLTKELNELYTNRNIVKLKYLYYECSNEIADDLDIIYDRIRSFLNNEWNDRHEELYNLVRLSYSKK